MKKMWLGAALTLISTGCVVAVGNHPWEDDGHSDWENRQEHNQRVINSLEIGRSLADVTAELGTADFTESFVRNGETFEVLFYRTRWVESDGRTEKNETTPLVFVQEELVGWGESALDKAAP